MKTEDVLVARGIDEVASGVVIGVQELETLLLVHGPHAGFVPLISDTHGSESNGREVHAGLGRKLPIATEFGLRGSCGGPVIIVRRHGGRGERGKGQRLVSDQARKLLYASLASIASLLRPPDRVDSTSIAMQYDLSGSPVPLRVARPIPVRIEYPVYRAAV